MKSDKELHSARMGGMAYALKIAHERGIEGLEKEVKFRNASFTPLEIPDSALREFESEVKNRMINTVMIAMYLALIDEFHFGKTRLKRLNERFCKVSESAWELDCNGQHYVTMTEFAEYLNKEYCGSFDIDLVKQVDLENDIARGLVKRNG